MSSAPSPLISGAPNPSRPASEDVSSSSRGQTSADPSPKGLYRAMWRWHFFAGLIVAPVMIVASVTGAIYVFHNELIPWVYRDLVVVEPRGERLTFDQQLEQLKGQVPEFEELDALSLRNDPQRSSEFITHAFPGGHENPNQMHRVYYVDPYSGKVLGTRLMEEEFFHQVLDFHRTLFAGTTGRVIVELATSWGLILVITGLYLWWPRTRGRVRGVWLPRLSGKTYPVLRDLHAVIGLYAATFAVIILATGLFTSAVWGSGFTWASVQMKQSLMDFLLPIASPATPEDGEPESLELIARTALERSLPGDNVYITWAEEPEKTHKVYVMTDGDTNTVRGLDIDQYTGKVVATTATNELTPMVRLLAVVESLHQGKTFGLTSKIIAFLTSIALIGLSITGVWMWWARRPRGETGFPKRPSGAAPKWIWAGAVLLGLVLPVAGASMIVFMIVETFMSRMRRSPVGA